MDSSKGSVSSLPIAVCAVLAGVFLLILFQSDHLVGKSLGKKFNLYKYVHTKSASAVVDTIGVIYDDIERRPARMRDRKPPDRIDPSVPHDPFDEDTHFTREELQGRLFAPTDSTARLKYFHHKREKTPYTPVTARRTHPFYLIKTPTVYERSVELDSLGTSVIIREYVNGTDVRVPVVVSLDDYIQARYKEIHRRGFEERAYEYELDYDPYKRADLGDFLGAITTIDIPVPPTPFLSIFGKPGIQLSISGGVDIRAGFRNQKFDETTASYMGDTRNEPDFKQDVQVNVSGLVGDKLNILADWNTQRTFEYENQLKIVYEGYDDEIIRRVEAGNVALQTPTRFIGSSQALFGIKTLFQFGPFSLTTIASQQKGRAEELVITGGAQEQSFEIRPYDYSRSHFFLDEDYIDLFEAAMAIDPQYDPNLEVTDIEVWITRMGGMVDPNERAVTAHINLPQKPSAGYDDAEWRNLTEGVSGEIELGQFVMLSEGEDYILRKHTGRLTMRTQVAHDQAIAVAYRRADGSLFGDFVSTVPDNSERLVLKLVKPRNLIPQYQDAWKLQLRNIYSIGGRNLHREGFELRVEYDIPGQQPVDQLEGQNLLNVLRLDLIDETGSPNPDNRFDWREGYTIDIGRGEVIIPALRPFDDLLVEAGLGEYRYPEVYDTTASAAQAQTEKDRFRIRGTFSSAATASYDLGFNIVEGSVVVYLDGNKLQPGVDYTVDYMLGQVTIRNEAALQPGADLRISYEQNELFQISQRTLLGARGELPIGRESAVNFTIMSLNEQTLSDKVRVGEEPINNVIFGIDGRTAVPMNFVTDALNALPFYNSLAESRLSLEGEAAFINPDRNTQKSRIPIDDNKGVAYIDDFEGARRSIPLGMNFWNWKYSSPPTVTPYLGELPPDSLVQHKARSYWYNIQPSDVVVTDIWPTRQVARGEEQVTVLDIHYEPGTRGEYNYSWDLENTVFNTPKDSWGGMMRALTGVSNNLADENVTFIEFWARVEGDPGNGGRMFINIGQVSERIIYEERLKEFRVNDVHQEDGSQGKPPSGTLASDEDVGLDGIATELERDVFADWLEKYPQFEDDPSGDNFRERSGDDYSGLIGVEGNLGTEWGRRPDTEDLNNNGITDLTNSYFEYELSLDTLNALSDHPYVVGGGHNGWYQFRIPLISYDRTIGNPSFDNVEFIRVWFSGIEEDVRIRMVEFSFTGNQWEEEIKGDSTMVVSVVNIEENPEYYSPPGVERVRDRTRPDEHILANEQSLALLINDMLPAHSRQALRYFPVRALDVLNYKAMRLFVHGDLDWYVGDEAEEYDAEIFIRFGSDTTNYYEYRQPIWPGWHENNFIHINFADLTAVKVLRDSVTNISPKVPVKDGPSGATYRVVRNPSLTNIRYMSIGIANPKSIQRGGTPLRGDVWVNELRLIDVDNSSGHAYRVSSTFQIADLGTVRFSYSYVDPNFHRLEQKFGSRQENRNWDAGVNLQLQRFLPDSWSGSELPFNYTRSENIISPKYIPGTDILVRSAYDQQVQILVEEGFEQNEAEETAQSVITETQTLRVSDTYSAPTVRFNLPSERWYVRETINNLTFGFNYNKVHDRTPTIERRESWAWQGRTNYLLNFSRENFFQPFKNVFDGLFLLDHYKDVKLYFSPGQLNTGFNLARTQTRERFRYQQDDRPVIRNFAANRNFAFNWRFTENAFINPNLDYRLDISSSLVHLEVDEFGNQRPFSTILSDIIGGAGLINFGIDNNYAQEIGFDSRPRLPTLLGLNRYFDISSGYRANYRWTRNLAQETLGRSGSVNTRFDLSLGINLKDIGNNIFGAGKGNTSPERGRPGRGSGREETKDPGESEDKEEQESSRQSLRELLEILIKMPFLDYDRVTISFNQSKNIQNSGLIGGTGFGNFWGKFPFVGEPDIDSGPSRMYQMGFSSKPMAIRAPNGNLIDNLGEANRISLRTQRTLGRGVRVDLVWNYGWSYNRSESLLSGPDGMYDVINKTTTGDIDRSYLTLPAFPGVKLLGGNIEEAARIYAEYVHDPADDRSDGEKLVAAFEEGMEGFSLLRTLFGDNLPRMNWNLRWDGLERIPLFDGWARRVSLDHAYSSSYTTRWRGLQGGGIQTEMQRVSMNFSPLIGLNVMFKEMLKGSLSANIRYNTASNYDLNYSRGVIVKNVTQELSLTASYGRRGFAIPFFGLALSNDIDISLTFSRARNERLSFANLLESVEGVTDDGSTRTSIEPRVRYVLSARVTAAIYYRYSKVTPNEAGSVTPGLTMNEAGLDINIAIR